MYTRIILQASVLLCLLTPCKVSNAQDKLISEPIYQKMKIFTAQIPADINAAYKEREKLVPQLDSLQKMIEDAHPALSAKVHGRSARLYTKDDTAKDPKLLLLPPNQKMTSFFSSDWSKMDALESSFNKAAPSFFGSKELYAAQGYLKPWDSVYSKYRPQLIIYRDGVLKLVQAELAYLKANEQMFFSKDEDERLQYVETELAVLQKLAMLRAKYHKTVVQYAIEKVEFCVAHPSSCQAKN